MLRSARHSPGGDRFERCRELFAVALHEIRVRPALEHAQAGLGVAGRAGVQRVDERAQRAFGAVAREHALPGSRSARARRTARGSARTTRAASSSSKGGSFDACVDHAERLEDHALADRGIALVDLQREAFAVQHLVVEPHAAQRVQLVFVRLAAACDSSNICRASLSTAASTTIVRGSSARPTMQMIDAEQHAAENDEVQQRLAQPARSCVAAASRSGCANAGSGIGKRRGHQWPRE